MAGGCHDGGSQVLPTLSLKERLLLGTHNSCCIPTRAERNRPCQKDDGRRQS